MQIKGGNDQIVIFSFLVHFNSFLEQFLLLHMFLMHCVNRESLQGAVQ